MTVVIFTDVPQNEDRNIWVVEADGSETSFSYLAMPFIEKSGVMFAWPVRGIEPPTRLAAKLTSAIPRAC